MGKKDKEHRAKIAKRNVKSNQEKYAMQNALNKIMKRMAEEKEAENLSVSVGEKEVPFQVESLPVGNSIVNFKEENPEFMSINQIPIDDFKSKHPELIMGNDEELREEFPLNIEGPDMPLDVDTTEEEI